ncbi:MAG TPA: rhomboid family intramembrane serine protease, partial [Planctomycetota bacterium]|nr:rhomboid family intramembrane serine protease [Planctomycetota bacterium]
MFPLKDSIPNRVTPLATFAIVGLNGLAFLLYADLDLPELTELFLRFGVVPARYALASDPAGVLAWPLLLPLATSQFLHAGLAHLVGNLWTLWIFGPNVEERMGPLRFVAFYLLAGAAAGLAHVAAHPGSGVPTVGASGSIAGVMGAYLVLYPRARILFFVPVLFFPLLFVLPAATYLLYWLALQLASGALSRLASDDAGGV